jgi:hypothetical protein
MRARCLGDRTGLSDKKDDDGKFIDLAGDELVQHIIANLKFTQEGFCKTSTLVPTKVGGYVQVSYGGANKFVVLQELLLWGIGVRRGVPADQCSHRCNNRKCTVVGHVCCESVTLNNGRKGCLVFVDCPHCQLKIFVCTHQPTCIKHAPGFSSWEDFVANGLH